jgi:hypothetical protein
LSKSRSGCSYGSDRRDCQRLERLVRQSAPGDEMQPVVQAGGDFFDGI